MPIPRIKTTPPPPRRAPPAAPPPANLSHDISSSLHTVTHLKLKPSGVAMTSQQLIKAKDIMNDVKIALATASDTIQCIATNPALLGPAAVNSAKCGVDIQSLEFAAATRGKLIEQEKKQDAYYASLREMADVAHEVQKAANDPSLQRYREEVKCQLSASTFSVARLPRESSAGVSRPIPPEAQQVLLNPFSTVRRQPLSNVFVATPPTSSTTSTNIGKSNATTFRPSESPSSPPHRMATAPPPTVVNGYYGPASSSSPPLVQHSYGGAPTTYGGGTYAGSSNCPPMATPGTAGGGYYGSSPYSYQNQPRPVYGQYSQGPPVGNQQANARPTYNAL